MIQISQMGMTFGERKLFSDVTFNLAMGSCYGVVGANGSGKSTFLKILTGELTPTTGEVRTPSLLRLGFLKQNHFEFENDRILDVVLMGNPRLWSVLKEKERLIHQKMLDEKDGSRLAELEMLISDLGGYEAETQAATLLNGLGIENSQITETMSTLSGGYKLRVLLAQCLFGKPNVLLFDEPNNHLDIVSIAWLGDYLVEYPGVVVVVSHDYHFLNQISTHILDIDYESIEMYKGNYVQFTEAKELEIRQREQEIVRQEKKQEELQAFYEHFRAKATKARQAISRKKQLDRMEDVVIVRSSRISPVFQFVQKRPSGKQALIVSDLDKSFDDNHVLKNVSFYLGRGDRIAVIGPNGVGKSTLIKILGGHLKHDSGCVEWGHEVSIGYFAQNHKELIPSGTNPYEWLYGFAPTEFVSNIRGILGKALFSGDDVYKRSETLSGGESARLIFARLMLEQNNVLLLDEPTNHLDLEAIEALWQALVKFPGTVVFVSHDRHFVEKTATAILELRHDGFSFFEGDYHDFLGRKGIDHLDRNVVPTTKNATVVEKMDIKRVKPNMRERRQFTKELSRLEGKAAKREEDILSIENEIADIDNLFAGSEIYLPGRQGEFQCLFSRQKKLKFCVHEEMILWEADQNRIAELNQLIAEIDNSKTSQ